MRRLSRLLAVTCAVTCTATGLIAHEAAAGGAAVAVVQPSGLVYTVVRGDSLSGIADKVHVRLADLLTLNQLTTSSLILPGMQLQVPAGGSLPTGAGGAQVALYTVVKGDSLLRISSRLHVTLAELLAANKLTRTSVILPGMQLVVPAGGTLPAAPSTPAPAPAVPTAKYTVVKGDSLIRISLKLNVTLAQLLAANGLSKQSVIHAGMQLVVPAGGTLPPADATASPATSSRIATVLAFARAQLGEPYRFNAAGPNAWDCSGLTMVAYAQIGVALPHYSAAQALRGVAVNWRTEGIAPGDLVFLETSPGSGVIGHVGIAISATQWIQAPRVGDVVRAGAIPTTRVVAVRRYVQP